MKMKELFSVPQGKGISDKYLYRVLISSICSILLCMGCLAGTTWAWFTVSLENAENVIQIGTPTVKVTVRDVGTPADDGQATAATEFSSGAGLVAGKHVITVLNAGNADDLDRKSTLYVAFSVGNEVIGRVVLNCENNYTASVQLVTDRESVLTWTASWFPPEGAKPLDGSAIDLREPVTTEPVTTEPSDVTSVPDESDTGAGEETVMTDGSGTNIPEETTVMTEAVTEASTQTEASVQDGAETTGETTPPAQGAG